MSASTPPDTVTTDLTTLRDAIRHWGLELGFQAIGVAGIDPGEHASHFRDWLAKGFHGSMDWMETRAALRHAPDALLPGTVRVITARMDYLPDSREGLALLEQPEKAYISHYALGRDYHKLVRGRLTKLGERIREAAGRHGFRAFVDSAPVLEKAYAEQAGLGWIGKHTLLLDRQAGSWFFLGEIFTDLPLPLDEPVTPHCGRCQACIDICPTRAIVAPWQLDARRCISYLTIEHKGSIPEEFRSAIGNRVFGCDDCQLVCPWNRFARPSSEADFRPRHGLDDATLVSLFLWTEEEYLARTEGMPLRRAGWEQWLRNLAVGLGNGPADDTAIAALQSRRDHPSAVVREHVDWALARLREKYA